MGYTTEFKGILKFVKELKASEIAYLSKILGVDFRDVPELNKKYGDVATLQYSIDLCFTQDYSGLQWDGAEKSYDMVKQVDFVIKYMRSKYPDFGLEGHMNAQGEEVDDRWTLVFQNGKAAKIMTPPTGKKVCCPHCGKYFYIGDEE